MPEYNEERRRGREDMRRMVLAAIENRDGQHTGPRHCAGCELAHTIRQTLEARRAAEVRASAAAAC